MSSRGGSTRITYFIYSCCSACCLLSAAIALCKCRSVLFSKSLANFSLLVLDCWVFWELMLFHVLTLFPLTISCSTSLQFLYRFSMTSECPFHWDHDVYMFLYLPPPGSNGGINPAWEICWKSSFLLLSPLDKPPLVPCFPSSFFHSLFFLFNRCLFSVRVLRSVAEVICFDRASAQFV